MEKFRIRPDDIPADVTIRSLADVLRWRAERQGDHTALTYLADGVNEAARLTHRNIDEAARAVAALLQRHDVRGGSVILLFEPGPEFLIGFLACIYAGAKGVPLYPPDVRRLGRTLPRFLAIVEDCQAGTILTTAKMRKMGTAVFEFAPQLKTRQWLAVEDAAGLHGEWKDPAVDADEISFLQYTSGSTGDPKGVEVSHRALLMNLSMLSELFYGVPGETMATWLPNYHDMGLIDGWMRPVYFGCHSVAMPPVAFLKNPCAWLSAISKYRAGVSGAPNFAYELCIAKVTDADLAGLDLRCWHTAYCGAEPVRAETIRRFAARFAPCGFKPEAFCPGYGLAEATLVVSCSPCQEPPVICPISRSALEQSRVVPARKGDPDALEAIGVGKPYMECVIVDPESRKPCPEGCVGEIWIAGPSLARGYMNRPEINREMFQARRADTGAGPYLRTGDMGFLRADRELFIAGRRKDLVIIRGKNHYPQDIEKTVEQADRAALRPGCTAAFAIDAGGEERLVVVQEVQKAAEGAPTGVVDATFRAIRAAVTEEHGVDPYAIVLIKPGTIPKTSSGKIQRRTSRDAFQKGELEVVASWQAGAQPAAAEKPSDAAAAEPPPTPRAAGAAPDSPKGAAIRKWLHETLAARLSIPPAGLDEQRPFSQLGLDSREGIILVGDLEKFLGTTLAVSIIYDHPSVDRLVRFLDGNTGPVPSGEIHPAAAHDEPIAIVGIGCRYPGADGPEAFWRLVRDGTDAVVEIPPDRWNRDAYYDADPAAPGKMVSKYGGFLRQIDQFDAPAFDITAREAARMDPQQRLLLEVSAEALENAGITPAACAGTQTGVFVGISSFDYARQLFGNAGGIDAFYGTGAALSIAANRISYQFDLHGPSMAIDSACSSSLVAVHAAIASLRRGECTMAIAGGVNAIILPDINITFTKAGVLSPNGHCRTFDARADGITRAEGAGAVILKPLSKARADGDHIWAVVKGSAVNSDGRSNGLMAPNGTAQQRVIAQAYRNAGADPAQVQYVEAHGTGTILGDPIEVGALAAVVSRERPEDRPCRIGSVKANFGHLEAGAGVAGLIKVALSLHHRELAPSIQFSEPNPGIPFERLKIKVQTVREPWPAAPGEALAGVSSFGFGGTNAHIVLGDAPQDAPGGGAAKKDGPVLVPISARSAEGLKALAEAYRGFLDAEGKDAGLDAIAWSAATRRSHAPFRLAVVAGSVAELHARVGDYLEGRHTPWHAAGEALPAESRKVALVFPGQGGQSWAMGRGLYEREPAYRDSLARFDAVFAPLSGWSVVEELLKDEKGSRVNETEHLQPMLCAVEIALYDLWRSLGVEPDAVVGHSMGEIPAAYAAGKLDLAEAARIIMHRGRIMTAARGKGAMIAVELPLDAAARIAADYPGKLAVAANNGPAMSVLAGDPAAIAQVAAMLGARDVFCREIRVEVAGHSPDMDPLAPKLAAAAGVIPSRRPRVHIVSTVTGAPADAIDFDAAYWAKNLREPVRFRNAVEVLLAQGFRTFLEVAPHPVLQNAIGQVAHEAGVDAHTIYTLKRDANDRESLLAAAGALHVLGVPVDLAALNPRAQGAVPLPVTPWDRRRC